MAVVAFRMGPEPGTIPLSAQEVVPTLAAAAAGLRRPFFLFFLRKIIKEILGKVLFKIVFCCFLLVFSLVTSSLLNCDSRLFKSTPRW